MSSVFLRLLTLFASLMLLACGASESLQPAPRSYDVYYSKGPVEGGSCSLYSADHALVAGPVTSRSGMAFFADVAYSGEIYADCHGGSYVDEATGSAVILDNNFSMRSTLGAAGTSGGTLVATPLTELAYRLALAGNRLTNSGTRLTANYIADRFGLDGIDIGSTVPRPLAELGLYNDTRAHYGTALAALSQYLADNRALGGQPDQAELNALLDSRLPQLLQQNGNYFIALNNLLFNTVTSAYIRDVSALMNRVDPVVAMEISFASDPNLAGTLYLQLDQGAAPITVANFLAYVDAGFYDNTLFHRVIDGFMVQGGGFDATNYTLKTTNAPIVNEANNGRSNLTGTIAMARTADPHSATSQFFINVADNTFLDYVDTSRWGYAVFGEVISGVQLLNAIKTQPTSSYLVNGLQYDDWPIDDIIIERVQRYQP